MVVKTVTPRANRVGEWVRNVVWSAGVRALHLGKRVGVSGPFEDALTKLATRVITPPTEEMSVRLPVGATLVVPPGFPRARSYAGGVYEQKVTSLVSNRLAAGMTFVDIGAFCGYYTLLGSRLIGDSGCVYAFEPHPDTFGYLTRNVSANGCTNVEAVNAAAGDESGFATLSLHEEADHHWLSSASEESAVRVSIVTLDEFFRERGWPTVNLMKIDVEGAEGSVLAGMRELSERHPGLEMIMEYDLANLARAGTTREGIATALAELGFRRGKIIEQGNREFTLPGGLPAMRGTYNLWLLKR